MVSVCWSEVANFCDLFESLVAKYSYDRVIRVHCAGSELNLIIWIIVTKAWGIELCSEILVD